MQFIRRDKSEKQFFTASSTCSPLIFETWSWYLLLGHKWDDITLIILQAYWKVLVIHHQRYLLPFVTNISGLFLTCDASLYQTFVYLYFLFDLYQMHIYMCTDVLELHNSFFIVHWSLMFWHLFRLSAFKFHLERGKIYSFFIF